MWRLTDPRRRQIINADIGRQCSLLVAAANVNWIWLRPNLPLGDLICAVFIAVLALVAYGLQTRFMYRLFVPRGEDSHSRD
jgi:hypothetical protein